MKHFLILYFLLSPHADRVLASSLSRSAPQLSEQADAFQRGLTALKDNRVENALEEFTTAEREHPDDPRVRNFRGIVLANLGQNAEAAAEYRESIRLDPRMGAPWNYLPATLLPTTISGGYSWKHSITYRPFRNWSYLGCLCQRTRVSLSKSEVGTSH